MPTPVRPTGPLIAVLFLLICCVAVVAWALLGGSTPPPSAITAPMATRVEAGALWNTSSSLAPSRHDLSSAGPTSGGR